MCSTFGLIAPPSDASMFSVRSRHVEHQHLTRSDRVHECGSAHWLLLITVFERSSSSNFFPSFFPLSEHERDKRDGLTLRRAARQAAVFSTTNGESRERAAKKLNNDGKCFVINSCKSFVVIEFYTFNERNDFVLGKIMNSSFFLLSPRMRAKASERERGWQKQCFS